MTRLIGSPKLDSRRFNCLRNAAILAGVIAVLSLLVARQEPSWIVSGLNVANVSIYLLLVGALALAVYRRNQVLKLQAALVQEQEQEIALIHAALNTHALVSLTDSKGNIISVNEKFADRYGYQAADLVGQSISQIHPDGEADPVFNEIRESLADGRIWAGESEEVTADGSKVFMRCTVVPMLDAAGSLVRSVSIRTDNTEFHRAEKARFLKNLFDHLHDEVYIYRVDDLSMVYANNSAIKASNWVADDLLGKTIVDADPMMDERPFRAHVEPLFSGEREVVSIEVKRGETTGDISTRLFRGDDGDVLFVSVLRDATERKQIENARMESVSVVSHELRTPLTSIKGSLRLLNSGALGAFDQKVQSVLDIAVRNTERLLLVVDEILDIEKIRAGKMVLDKTVVDLVNFVDDVVEMNKGYGDELHVEFAFQSDLDSAPASIAPERMMQVLANLLSNAAKYSPSGGTVQVGLREDGDFWRISVSDAGPGIPEDARKTVFESFSQLNNADGETRKGTGLGLTIAQKLVHAHKGEIDFESELGKGTTFYVRLPILTESERSADVANSAGRGKLSVVA